MPRRRSAVGDFAPHPVSESPDGPQLATNGDFNTSGHPSEPASHPSLDRPHRVASSRFDARRRELEPPVDQFAEVVTHGCPPRPVPIRPPPHHASDRGAGPRWDGTILWGDGRIGSWPALGSMSRRTPGPAATWSRTCGPGAQPVAGHPRGRFPQRTRGRLRAAGDAAHLDPPFVQFPQLDAPDRARPVCRRILHILNRNGGRLS